MRKLTLVVGLAAAVLAAQPGWAAEKKGACYSQTTIEAEQAIRFITDLMVVSSVRQDTIYAEFRLRNKDAIIAYQKALITHFRGAPAFDKWNTAIANLAAQKQASVSPAEFWQQSEAMLKQASALDTNAFRAYASARAASVGEQYVKCGGKKK